VGNVISGVGLGIFAEVIRPWAPTAEANFMTQAFIGN